MKFDTIIEDMCKRYPLNGIFLMSKIQLTVWYLTTVSGIVWKFSVFYMVSMKNHMNAPNTLDIKMPENILNGL